MSEITETYIHETALSAIDERLTSGTQAKHVQDQIAIKLQVLRERLLVSRDLLQRLSYSA